MQANASKACNASRPAALSSGDSALRFDKPASGPLHPAPALFTVALIAIPKPHLHRSRRAVVLGKASVQVSALDYWRILSCTLQGIMGDCNISLCNRCALGAVLW